MVINKNPDREKKRLAEERLNRPKDVQKEALISELRKESVSIICLALMYAKNFEETQEDLTKRLINVNQNADLLQRVYNKGYEDGLSKGREMKHENKGNSNSNIIGSSFNGQIRDDSV